MSSDKTIVIANDHAGLPLKPEILAFLKDKGFTVLDMGTDTYDSVDYPDYANLAVSSITSGRASEGILICGSGIGMSIAANRYEGIRAALCGDVFSAKVARLHNDANVLIMGARVIGAGLALEITQAFFTAAFSQGERHISRIGKIDSNTK